MVRSAVIAGALLAISENGEAAPVVPPPAASVRGHSVVHAPTDLTIRVPKSATFVGKERFDLKGVADGEIEVFVEADKHKKLTRLYWIQFEHPWPDQTWRYDYTGDRREYHWGTTVWVNSGPGSTADTPQPRSDTEHVRAMLHRAGYTLPPAMMSVRMIQLLDDPKGTGHGGRELMFIYGEDLAHTGTKLSDVTDAKGETNAAWEPIGRALEKRALAAFEVLRR